MRVVLKASEADRQNVRGWLERTTEYVVLSVEANASGGLAYRIGAMLKIVSTQACSR